MGQSGRYEYKYIVDEARAVAIADYLRAHVRPSVHNEYSAIRGHPVVSLYLDSPDFFFFHQGFAGHKNRIKLRIRFYDDQWTRPAFLEIKRRVADVICKDRAMISREAVQRMLLDGWPHPRHWHDPRDLGHGKKRLDVYEQFWSLMHRVRARGLIYISYIREIWEAPDDEELRVTFDRQVRATLYDGTGRLHMPRTGFAPPPDRPPFYLPLNGIVLELKWEGYAPFWMVDMVRIFNLERRPMCKFCASIDGAMLQWGGRGLKQREHPLHMTDGGDAEAIRFQNGLYRG